jgi:MGT family glycosyltransferase
MSNNKKIYILFPSGTGHINPVLGLVHELCKQPNIECIFYGIEEHKEPISRTGAEYRQFANRNYANMVLPNKTASQKEKSLIILLNTLMDSAYDILPQLLKDFEQDRPNVILFDSLFVPARYLLVALRSKDINVKAVEFFPNFVLTKQLIESIPESNIFGKDFNSLLKFGNLIIKQSQISWKFGLSIYNPIDFVFGETDFTKLVAVFPELQPNVEAFGKQFKFVGQCVCEDVRGIEMKNDPELKSFLRLFRGAKDLNKRTHDLKLILVSLGTVFNYNTFVFEEIIKAIREFNKSSTRHFSSSQFLVVISVGNVSYRLLTDKINKGELIIPETILIRAKVPQLEILKRADLFITHCGMNSTTEAIKYAVPIIAVPIEADQPLVARRVCEELSAGIRINMSNLQSDEIADAIDKVLSDEKYAKNMKDLSLASAKYNGIAEGSKIVLDILGQ